MKKRLRRRLRRRYGRPWGRRQWPQPIRSAIRSAGTVEFLLDGDEYWFLEINTRLQVEHPITEEITGLDLVREQIRLAEGERLGFTQADLEIDGHAIEARVYAEDPANDFLPSPGTVEVWAESAQVHARYDTGVESGSEVSQQFDPMIAKVIVHAPTRREAAARLARALETTRIQGLTHNRDFLVACLRAPEFIAGDTTTDFIERVRPAVRRVVTAEEQHSALIAAALLAQHERRSNAKVLSSIASGWRNSSMPPQFVQYTLAGASEEITLRYTRNRQGVFSVTIDSAAAPDAEGANYQVKVDSVTDASDGAVIALVVNNRRQQFSVSRSRDQWLVHSPHGDLAFSELPRFKGESADGVEGGLLAPMPGKVLSLNVAAGDVVEKGQVLLILEAMKMEHRLTAPQAGVVSAVHIAADEQAANGQLLIELQEQEDSA